jgi:ABC-type phosphate transport system substrate-binding protein
VTVTLYSWLLLFALQLAAEPVDPITVVVNPALTDEIGKLPPAILPAVFAMRMRTWPDKSQIRVFVLANDNPVHSAFCKQVLGVFPHQIRTAWDRLIYSGTGQAPTEVESEDEMRQRVATTPGAIGYLRRSMINNSVAPLPWPDEREER